MTEKTEYKINNQTWIVERDQDNNIIDVGVQLTREVYKKIRSKMADPGLNFSNSSSVDILKNSFRKARAELTLEGTEHQAHQESHENPSAFISDFLNTLESEATTHLEVLSRSINGQYDNPRKKIEEIRDNLLKYNDTINEITKKLEGTLDKSTLTTDQKLLILKDISRMKAELREHNLKLFNQLDELKSDHKKIDLFLSAQNRDGVYALGSFIGDQTRAIAKAAINTTSIMQNRYLTDVYYQKNEITGAFIEADSALRIRHSSHYGARYVNTQTAYDQDENLPENGFFSILPFMKNRSASELDKMICLISETPLSQRTLSTLPKTWTGLFGYGIRRASIFLGLYTLAPVGELAITAVHLPLSVFFTLIRTPFSPLLSEGNALDKIISGMNQIHQNISPMLAMKNLWNSQYKRLNKEGKVLDNNDPHQKMIDDFNQMNNESLMLNATKAITPQNAGNLIRLGYHLVYQALGTIGLSTISALTAPFRLFKRTPSDQELFEKYDQNYHLTKKIMETVIAEAEESSKNTTREQPERFPGLKRQQDYSAESPAKVINEVMYLLNEKVIHHLAEHNPGPGTFFFMMSVATFGSNFAPIGALAWMHGAPGYFKLIQSGIAQAFTGYTGPMTGGSGAFHGSVAALLQFKLFTIGSTALLNASDKNNDILEQMAKNPEKMIAGFVAFVGIGYALGYVPKIPSVPNGFSILGQHVSTEMNGVNVLDGYNLFVNSLTSEATALKDGMMPFTTLEYGFLGYKTMLLANSMMENGKPIASPRETAQLMDVLKQSKILEVDEKDKDKNADEIKASRNEKITTVLKNMNHPVFSKDDFILKMQNHITLFLEKDRPVLEKEVNTTMDKINKEKALWDKIIQNESNKIQEPLNSCQKLERAITMLSDKDMPCAFTQKREAIQYYNALSKAFDEYNQDVSNGKYPCHNAIPKEDFLRAFRNKHISEGSNNLARMLSFYPGYPFRYLWREIQLKINPTPYVKDKIQASREKDRVLRNDWIAIVKMSAYNFMNLINKAVKATIGALPTMGIIGLGVITNIGRRLSGKALDFTSMQVQLQKLGRTLDNIAIQNLLPWSKSREQFARAIHESSRYDDLVAEGSKVSQRLSHNQSQEKEIKDRAKVMKEVSNKPLENFATRSEPEPAATRVDTKGIAQTNTTTHELSSERSSFQNKV